PFQQAWQAVQSDCDAVMLPYPNPAGGMERLFRHHFPSKLPEYLALGMPVIITGPSYATGMKWAQQQSEAVATYSEVDVEGVSRLLERLRDHPEYRLKLSKAGYQAGNRDFEPVRIKTRFLTYLSEVGHQVRLKKQRAMAC